LAQTVIHRFRNRLGAPFAAWDADHLASGLFRALDGDIRVVEDTIVVTYYNAPKDLVKDNFPDFVKECMISANRGAS